MGKSEFCSKGITTRAMRQAFCDELKSNPALVKVVTKAAGAKYVSKITEITMKNHGEDLRISCVAHSSFMYIHLDVQMDKTFGRHGFKKKGKLPTVEVIHDGSFRTVTIAPEIWFRHTGNARYAQNMVSFESLEKLASDDFFDALQEGIKRADNSFEEMMRPRQNLPLWAIMRIGEGRQLGYRRRT